LILVSKTWSSTSSSTNYSQGGDSSAHRRLLKQSRVHVLLY
jgi:hypothetical protein